MFVTAKGVTLVDTKNPGWGQPLLDKIKTLTDKPVTTVINTHTHFDHVSGNVAMPATVEIVAHDYTAKNIATPQLDRGHDRGAPENVFKENPGKGLAEAHLQGQADDWLGRRSDQPLLLRSRRTPAATRSSNSRRTASCTSATPSRARACRSWTRTTAAPASSTPTPSARRSKGVTNIDTIINGHTAAQTTPADMREFADFVAEFVAHVQAGKKAGKTRRAGREGVDRRRRSTRASPRRAADRAPHGVRAR